MFKPFYFKLHCPAHPKIDQIGFPNGAAWPQSASTCLYCSGLFFQPLYRIYAPQPSKNPLVFRCTSPQQRAQKMAARGENWNKPRARFRCACHKYNTLSTTEGAFGLFTAPAPETWAALLNTPSTRRLCVQVQPLPAFL